MTVTRDRITRDSVEPRVFNTGERAGYDTRIHLANATRQAQDRGLDKVLIVDADAHHLNEMVHFREIIKYIDDDVLRNEVLMGESGVKPANCPEGSYWLNDTQMLASCSGTEVFGFAKIPSGQKTAAGEDFPADSYLVQQDGISMTDVSK